MNICLAVMCYLLVFAEPVVLFVSGEAFAGAVTPVRIIGAVSLMSCVSYFVAMCILSPLGRERQMAVSSIAAAPVSVALNLLLGGPFGAVDAGVALLATEATVLRIELWCARDVPSSFVCPRDLACMVVSNAVAAAVSAGCAWLLATAFSAGPGAIAIAGLLVCAAVDIAAAAALRDDTALMLVGKVRAVLRRG
ncbi:polysaccharide biosynthesis C-terminal domain-containing protein [Collinsella intestinalis]|uniref:polysaccharide biosynthesis C-terminal domain-containing protein n=1 Tax=Collinsella intestinalis TaxID=147207 RepID=UPI0022DEFA83|nr:polysaccharide biosynthesis C-terminal domain-containing protein [Collinsella intestinalis]